MHFAYLCVRNRTIPPQNTNIFLKYLQPLYISFTFIYFRITYIVRSINQCIFIINKFHKALYVILYSALLSFMRPICITFFSFMFLFLSFCDLMLKVRFIPIFFAINFVDTNIFRIFVVSKGKNIKYSFWLGSLDVVFASYFLSVSLNGKVLASAFLSRSSAWSEKELDNILIELFYLSSLIYLSK